MTNIGELLINTVRFNKLKVLTSLGQKARSRLPLVFGESTRTQSLPVERQGLTRPC